MHPRMCNKYLISFYFCEFIKLCVITNISNLIFGKPVLTAPIKNMFLLNRLHIYFLTFKNLMTILV